jgi:hypothetical protein
LATWEHLSINTCTSVFDLAKLHLTQQGTQFDGR